MLGGVYNMYDIKSIAYKFSRNTLAKADNSISHIKRNKKIYKKVVLFLAVCLSPMLMDYSKYFIESFIYELSVIPKEHLFEYLFSFFKNISLKLISLSIIFDMTIKMLKKTPSNAKVNIKANV